MAPSASRFARGYTARCSINSRQRRLSIISPRITATSPASCTVRFNHYAIPVTRVNGQMIGAAIRPRSALTGGRSIRGTQRTPRACTILCLSVIGLPKRPRARLKTRPSLTLLRARRARCRATYLLCWDGTSELALRPQLAEPRIAGLCTPTHTFTLDRYQALLRLEALVLLSLSRLCGRVCIILLIAAGFHKWDIASKMTTQHAIS
jgi:hypothetical protein